MEEIHCRYCNYYLFSAVAKEGKVRITCRRCKRNQVVDLERKGPPPPSHLVAAGL